MFDQEAYKKLHRISRTDQVAMNERVRRSSGHVATLCWNNLRIQPMVGEDLEIVGATAVPSREINLRRGPCCFGTRCAACSRASAKLHQHPHHRVRARA
jgi:hypothetical protein